MTPLHAWLRGLSSDSCGPFRGAWATDAENIDATAMRAAFAQIEREINNDRPTMAAIAAQRIGEVVGRWEGVCSA